MAMARNQIIHGDWIEAAKALPDGCVQTIITSPPYWGQRNYSVDGQLGLEQTFEEHIEKLVEGFREMRRILRDDGILWVNYGDKYASGKGKCYNPGGGEKSLGKQVKLAGQIPLDRGNISDVHAMGLQQGDLIGLAWRLALAMQNDGWILRSDVVWAKAVSMNDKYSGSTMPESINGTRWERCRKKRWKHIEGDGFGETRRDKRSRDFGVPQTIDCPGCPKCEANGGYVLRRGSWRCTRAHEYLFQFVKQIPYFADMEAVKEENISMPHNRGKGPCGLTANTTTQHAGADAANREPDRIWKEEGGRNLRDVWTPSKDPTDSQEEMDRLFQQFLQWLDMYEGNLKDTWTINPKAYKGAHYATFPEDLVEPCIKVSTSQKGCCPKCGAAWARVIETTTLGWRPTCNCPGLDGDSPGSVCADEENWPTVPCVVYDPFMGSGTVAAVAARLGRDYIGSELSADYLKHQARPRIQAAETGMTKAEIDNGQKALFGRDDMRKGLENGQE